MGSWGLGNFDSDEAQEWMARLLESGCRFVRSMLEAAAVSGAAWSNANICCDALAAAEFVAASFGRPPNEPPEELLGWAQAHAGRFSDADIELAIRVVTTIESGSYLQELFDEAGRNEAWHGELVDLVGRLRTAMSVDRRA